MSLAPDPRGGLFIVDDDGVPQHAHDLTESALDALGVPLQHRAADMPAPPSEPQLPETATEEVTDHGR